SNSWLLGDSFWVFGGIFYGVRNVASSNYGAQNTLWRFAAPNPCGSVASGPVVHTGDITITTQAQLDSFKSASGEKYTHVDGKLFVLGNNATDPITDFCNLEEIQVVKGDFAVSSFSNTNSPDSLMCFGKLDSVYGDFNLALNTRFKKLEISSLAYIGKALNIRTNQANQGNWLIGKRTMPYPLHIKRSIYVTHNAIDSLEIGCRDVNSSGWPFSTSISYNPDLGNFRLHIWNRHRGKLLVGDNPRISSIYIDVDSVEGWSEFVRNGDSLTTTADWNYRVNVMESLLRFKENNHLTISMNSADRGYAPLSYRDSTQLLGQLDFTLNTNMHDVSMDKIALVDALSFQVSYNSFIPGSKVTVDGLRNYSQNIDVSDNTGLKRLSLSRYASELYRLTINNNSDLDSLVFSSLQRIGNTLEIKSNTRLANFDIAFPQLNHARFLRVTDNPMMGQCCIATCVSSWGKTIARNTGNCADLPTAQAACSPTLLAFDIIENQGAYSFNAVPQSDSAICEGDLPRFWASARTTGMSSATRVYFTYFKDNNNNTAFDPASGDVLIHHDTVIITDPNTIYSSYALRSNDPQIANNDRIHVEISTDVTTCYGFLAEAVVMTVNPLPSISSVVENSGACTGRGASLTATGTGFGALKYQWTTVPSA
ncbi:MAG: hypothetical protein R3B47_21485, partial [Bacteroidia bacterium]